jgi:hypothetical protein
MKKRTTSPLPPLSDSALASAEQTQSARDRAHMEALEDEQEQTRLALAGDPEAMAALQAGSSILLGRPLEPPPPKKERKPVKRNAKLKMDEAPEPAPPDSAFANDAYKLMDTAFRKWSKRSEKNPREAFRDLARDLGADTALYLQAGVLRLSDMLDSMMKLTALGKPKEEEPEGGEDFDAELESMRSALRGSK